LIAAELLVKDLELAKKAGAREHWDMQRLTFARNNKKDESRSMRNHQ